MITVSTSKTGNSAYHHGDLRAALIAEGLRLVEDKGADALSLREVARGVGVSATAVYRHFPDKRALMTALADEGVRRLAAAQAAAAEQAPTLPEAFLATGRTYVRFALDNPGLFRTTFTYPGIDGPDPANDSAAFLLHSHALALVDGDEQRARALALHAWALVHGLAMLILDGRVPDDPELIDRALLVVRIPPTASGEGASGT